MFDWSRLIYEGSFWLWNHRSSLKVKIWGFYNKFASAQYPDEKKTALSALFIPALIERQPIITLLLIFRAYQSSLFYSKLLHALSSNVIWKNGRLNFLGLAPVGTHSSETADNPVLGEGGHWPWRLTETCRWRSKNGPYQLLILTKFCPICLIFLSQLPRFFPKLTIPEQKTTVRSIKLLTKFSNDEFRNREIVSIFLWNLD